MKYLWYNSVGGTHSTTTGMNVSDGVLIFLLPSLPGLKSKVALGILSSRARNEGSLYCFPPPVFNQDDIPFNSSFSFDHTFATLNRKTVSRNEEIKSVEEKENDVIRLHRKSMPPCSLLI